MARIKFLLKSSKNPANIYIRVREGRAVDAFAPTKLYINPAEWNPAKGEPKNLKSETLKQLKADLDSLTGKMLSALNKRNPIDIINAQWVKDIIIPPPAPLKESLPNDIVRYFEKYIKGLELKIKIGEATQGTVTKYRGIKKILGGMERELKAPILIESINNDFKTRFDEYCLKNGYAPNTVGRAIKFVKTVCRDARNNGLETHPQLDQLQGKTHKIDHIHLSFAELEEIEKTKLPHEYLDNARDWLIISCYTGQRVSDFMRFTKEMIRVENGKKLIEFTQVKTNKIMTLPLHKKVFDILKKRKGEFPRQISDQRYNEYIKEVCKLAGLTQRVKGSKQIEVEPESGIYRKETGIYEKWELVASHIGRRSFASNFYGIIPTSLLIHATGHSTEKMFLLYLGKTDTQKAIQLAEYF